jgi:hypothetical protein
MAGIIGSFAEVKKAIGVVVTLLILAFVAGYCTGKQSVEKKSLPLPSASPSQKKTLITNTP